jgi:transposase-like protein
LSVATKKTRGKAKTVKMSQNVPGFEGIDRRIAAAQLVAEGDLTDEMIAEKLGLDRRTLTRWRNDQEFIQRIADVRCQSANALLEQGIRLRENRLANLQRRVDKMHQLVEARAAKMAETQEIEGGETGLLVRDYKGKDANRAVYHFDAALMRELREHEKQAATELGEWTEKRDLTTKGQALDFASLAKLATDEKPGPSKNDS